MKLTGSWRNVLPWLLAADAVLLAGHIGSAILSPDGELWWSVTTEGGAGESFQYMKFAATAGLLLCVGWRLRDGLAGAWALLMVMLMIDDAVAVHEALGAIVARRLPAGLSNEAAISVGELLVVGAMFGLPLLLILAGQFRREWSRSPRASRFRPLIGGVIALVASAVVLDFVHGLLIHTPLNKPLGALEDGGEMFAVSFLLAASLKLFQSARAGRAVDAKPAILADPAGSNQTRPTTSPARGSAGSSSALGEISHRADQQLA